MSNIQYVNAQGLRFAYLEEGPKDGPLLLMVHGFPDTPHTWDHARPAMAVLGFRVVTPFTRGYAPTEIPREERYDSDTLGQDVLALATALGAEKFVLVGHDWGASAAYSAAGLASERIRCLVTVGIPHPGALIPTPRLAWIYRHMLLLGFSGAARQIRAGDFAHLDELVQRWSPGWTVPKGETDAVKRSLGEPGSLEAALGYYRAISLRLPAAQRKKISSPTVVFAGEDDYVPLSAYERARGRFTGPYEIVRMRGAHFMHRERPEQFVRELSRVLGPYTEG